MKKITKYVFFLIDSTDKPQQKTPESSPVFFHSQCFQSGHRIRIQQLVDLFFR